MSFELDIQLSHFDICEGIGCWSKLDRAAEPSHTFFLKHRKQNIWFFMVVKVGFYIFPCKRFAILQLRAWAGSACIKLNFPIFLSWLATTYFRPTPAVIRSTLENHNERMRERGTMRGYMWYLCDRINLLPRWFFCPKITSAGDHIQHCSGFCNPSTAKFKWLISFTSPFVDNRQPLQNAMNTLLTCHI